MTQTRKTKAPTREMLVRRIERATKKRVNSKQRINRSCLWYAHETIRELDRQGVRAVLQAGSASWLIVPEEHDDGISPTHYSYECEITPRSLMEMITIGVLPEMHVWAAIPNTNEVIDLTTRYLPELSASAGLKCQIDYPPYVWENVRVLSDMGMYYKPTMAATQLAMHLIMERLEQ